MADILFKNGICVLPGQTVAADIAVENGKIIAIGALANSTPADTTIDCKGLHILPGCIDSQVHFREPGNEHKEDLATGSTAAVLGGITSFFEMPNTNPSTTTVASLEDKLQRAAGRCFANYGFYAGVTADNIDVLPDMEKVIGCCGLKIFMGSSTGTLLVEQDKAIKAALAATRKVVAIHAEDEQRLKERKSIAEKAGNPLAHPEWRDEIVCLTATKRVITIAKELNRQRVHILHLTTAEELSFLENYKDLCTIEVTPQHLTLSAPDCYEKLGTYAQMNPAIRGAHHQTALWQGIASGLIDIIGSDHAPHTREEKEKPYPQSPSGMPGVQTLLPLMLNHVHAGKLTLERLVDLLCYAPQRVFNIVGKGRLALGYDADLTIVDLKRQETISHQQQGSKCGWTPFDGMEVTGWPVMTIVGGQIVMRDGAVVGAPNGKPVICH